MSQPAVERWDWALIRRRCVSEALRIVRVRQDAEEVVQEAMVRAWRSRGSCRTPEAPLPWCLQITRNEALRLVGRRRVASWEPFDPDALIDLPATGEHDRLLTQMDINRAVGRLSPEDQLLIDLRYVQDCSHPEIASRLQIPESTARVRLHRAHKQLARLLGDPTQEM